MVRPSLVLIAVLASGCVVDEDELSVIEQEGCGSCLGNNGCRGRAFQYMPGQVGRNALKNAGLWDSAADGPLSFCNPAYEITPTGCTGRWKWKNWIETDTTNTRMEIYTYLVKAAAPPGFGVKTGNHTYKGAFDVAPNALSKSWSYKDQERITGGLTALLNMSDQGGDADNWQVCLSSENNPTCDTAATWVESYSTGNLWRGSLRIIVGGKDGPDIRRNIRWQNPDGGGDGSAELIEVVKRNNEAYCQPSGSGASYHVTYCDVDGVRWRHPVTVKLTFNPTGWFYDRTLSDGWGNPTGPIAN